MVLNKKTLEKVAETHGRLKKCVYTSCPIILWRLIVPMMVIILIFLGAVQVRYPHESTFQEDLNSSMGTLGLAFYSIYNVGLENPRWFYYFFFIFGGMACLIGNEVYHNVRCVWSGLDKEMSAEDIVDSIGDVYLNNPYTEMKVIKRR